MGTHVYQDGHPYSATRTRWPESPHLRIDQHGIELAIFLENPTDREVMAVREGTPWFAWLDGANLGLLAYMFGDRIPWSDCPFNPHLARLAGEPYGLPPGVLADTGQLVHVLLVNALTGIIACQRMISWPEQFVRAVGESVVQLLSQAWDARGHDAELDKLYRAYPVTETLVIQRTQLICLGGTNRCVDRRFAR